MTSDLQIEHERQFHDGQAVTLVRLSGELNDVTLDAAQAELYPLVVAGSLHWRLDLNDLRLMNAGASFLFGLALHVHRQGGSVVLLNVNRRHQKKLAALPFSGVATIEPLPQDAPEIAEYAEYAEYSPG